MAQAAWVSLCLMPVLAVNMAQAPALVGLPTTAVTDVVGLALFAVEVLADRQKEGWRVERMGEGEG
ncbi:hypothetical protein F4779DRAFT_603983 [Xylariaceae sp. FL0662B]|nr:hypothetical protein F4779DRAFT_603983 [Xylariaceae sp. FL0662B]